jgi:hypothetical protein
MRGDGDEEAFLGRREMFLTKMNTSRWIIVRYVSIRHFIPKL